MQIKDVAGAAYQLPANTPAWLAGQLAQAGVSRFAAAKQGRVHYLTWNWARTELPVLVLVHGFRAHARWWQCIAPRLSRAYRVVSVDLPGMGDSDYCRQYYEGVYAEGILAVLDAEQLTDVTIIGHSFGGAQTLQAMCLQPELFRRGIVVDSLLRLPGDDRIRLLEPRSQYRYRASQEQCMAEFRLLPEQPAVEAAVLYHIVYHSCCPDVQGWRWKFDPAAINIGEVQDVTVLQQIRSQVDCIYGSLSIFAEGNRPERTQALFAKPGRLIKLAGAHHHMMVDQPQALADAIEALLVEP